MKNKPTETPTDTPPIVVVLPSTIHDKMMAIVNLSIAIKELSVAINSTNVKIDFQDINISNAETGIVIKTE